MEPGSEFPYIFIVPAWMNPIGQKNENTVDFPDQSRKRFLHTPDGQHSFLKDIFQHLYTPLKGYQNPDTRSCRDIVAAELYQVLFG